jgi:hypothetical protein
VKPDARLFFFPMKAGMKIFLRQLASIMK